MNLLSLTGCIQMSRQRSVSMRSLVSPIHMRDCRRWSSCRSCSPVSCSAVPSRVRVISTVTESTSPMRSRFPSFSRLTVPVILSMMRTFIASSIRLQLLMASRLLPVSLVGSSPIRSGCSIESPRLRLFASFCSITAISRIIRLSLLPARRRRAMRIPTSASVTLSLVSGTLSRLVRRLSRFPSGV